MKWYFAIFLTLLQLLEFSQAQDDGCFVCNSNGVACISPTEFNICQDGYLHDMHAYTCPKDTVCTAHDNICMPSANVDVRPACIPTYQPHCRKCAKQYPGFKNKNNQTYACIGFNKFVTCDNDELTSDVVYKCEASRVCNIHAYENTGHICVDDCVLNSLSYPTTCYDTKPPYHHLQQACNDYDPRPNIGCYDIQNHFDPHCMSYISCRRNQGQIEAQIIECDIGFYDINQNKCVAEHPMNCGQPVTTAAPLMSATTARTIDA